jgi:hypothetical protein
MYVLIGAPVYAREWILPYWLQAIELQDWPLDQVGFVFVVAEEDTPTKEILLDWHSRHPEVRCFDLCVNTTVQHRAHPDGKRHWNYHRYNEMAMMRNQILDQVCCRAPDRYLSLDTDMLITDPKTISDLVKLEVDAVAPLAYMSEGTTDYPNVMSWTPWGKGFRKNPYPLGTTFQADIIMAVKMMSPDVYRQVRYAHHSQGEDLGWSAHAKERGFRLWSASHLYVPHIMHASSLPKYLAEGDSRGDVAHFRRLKAPAPGTVVVSSSNA